jgi:transcriptional regulator with XRE-family HTH domain
VTVVSGTSPVARQRELGIRLRALRTERGMTVEEVAAELLCSTTKISRLETAARRPSLRDVRDLCVLYQLDEQMSQELMSLAREARESGWWTEYADLGLDPLIGLEQEATSITCYSMYYMPGLLQTEEYAELIIKTVAPKMDPHVVRQRTTARIRRQEVLGDNGPLYNVLLDEMVFRRGVGSPSLMAAQVGKVLQLVHSNRITVQVIPFKAGAYAAADSYFVLLEFDDESSLWPVVYIEGLTDNQYLRRGPDIARYRETVEYLRGRALDPDGSIEFMENVRKEYERGD